MFGSTNIQDKLVTLLSRGRGAEYLRHHLNSENKQLFDQESKSTTPPNCKTPGDYKIPNKERKSGPHDSAQATKAHKPSSRDSGPSTVAPSIKTANTTTKVKKPVLGGQEVGFFSVKKWKLVYKII